MLPSWLHAALVMSKQVIAVPRTIRWCTICSPRGIGLRKSNPGAESALCRRLREGVGDLLVGSLLARVDREPAAAGRGTERRHGGERPAVGVDAGVDDRDQAAQMAQLEIHDSSV